MSEPIALPLARSRESRLAVSPVRQVTDAFASGEAIHWPAAEGLARSARARRLTRQLRLLAALAGESHRPVSRPASVGSALGPPALVTGVTMVAIAQVVLSIAAAAQHSGLLGRPGGIGLIGAATGAVVASWLGVRERTSPAIGLVLWLAAAGMARPTLAATTPAGWLEMVSPVLVIECVLPFALWRLATETPTVVRFTRFEVVARRLRAAALASSLVAGVATLPVLRAADIVGAAAAFAPVVAATAWAIGALAVMAARTRRASSADVRAVRCIGATVAVVVALLWGAWVAGAAALSPLLWALAISLPWLAARAVAPSVAPSSPRALRSTWSVLRRLHASRDRDADLGRLATAMSRARTPREVASTLARGLRDTLRTPVAAVLGKGESGWVSLDGSPLALESEGALSAVLERADTPLRVDPRAPIFELLPQSDRTWLAACGVEVVVRLSAADGRTIAGLLVGGRPDQRRCSRRDLVFAAAAAATAAIAMDACARTGREIGAQAVEDEFAFECGACGRIDAEPGVCRCGTPRQLAALPMQLAGKFRLERRIGRGGMGVVYLAVDRFLGRLVALKTLPRLSAHGASALHAEAKAMASLDHPSVAVVYGLEVWRDTPVLVAEYLGRGTLAGRLAQGPMPLREAMSTGMALADTLADLHARGWLHRDIKPSNVGIGRGGAPKLLDFGLTRLVTHLSSHDADADGTDAGDSGPVLAGTPLYLSPEALDGQPVGEDGDVWGLALVVFEMISGTHPYRAATFEDVRRQARRTSTIDIRAWAPATPPAIADVITAALHPDRSQRLATAREFGAALRAACAEPADDRRREVGSARTSIGG